VPVRALDLTRKAAESTPLGQERKRFPWFLVGNDEHRKTRVERFDGGDDLGGRRQATAPVEYDDVCPMVLDQRKDLGRAVSRCDVEPVARQQEARKAEEAWISTR
jgi:hypothetical protein